MKAVDFVDFERIFVAGADRDAVEPVMKAVGTSGGSPCLYPDVINSRGYEVGEIAQLRRVGLDVRGIYGNSIVRGGFDKSVAG